MIPRPRCGINDVIYRVLCDYACFWDEPKWFMGFGGVAWTIEPLKATVESLIQEGRLPAAHIFPNRGERIDFVARTVPNINLSGVLAIACAILEGYDRIVLWGYDGGGKVFFETPLYKGGNDYERYNDKYGNLITPGVEIVNMINPECESKIKYFERCHIPTNFWTGS